MNCNEAVAALIASLERGETLTDEHREHIRTCERCRELLDSARQFQSMLAPVAVRDLEVEEATRRAEQEVRTRRMWRVWVRLFLTILVAGGIAVGIAAWNDRTGFPEELLAAIVGGTLVAMLVAVPFLLLITVARGVTRPAHGRPLYKRLGPGRALCGVALGIAEATGWKVSIVRLMFIVGLFFDGVGLIIYILLALFMPVHPDDRQHLLRFRLRRAFGRAGG